jgi:two-component system sensor histidine kinase DegS
MFGVNMVKSFLEKTRHEFNEHRLLLLDQITTCENHIKENDKFIKLLEANEDPNYDAFTPREKNSFNRQKIEELYSNQKLEKDRLVELQDHLGELDFKIADITSVIKEASEKYDEFLLDIDDYDNKLAILRSVESERQRIARDLHDSTTQNLTALVHKSELCAKLLDSDTVRCKLELYNIETSLRKIIEDMRGIIYDLRPMSFDDMGFDVTVERYLDKFHNIHNIACSYHVSGKPYPFDSVVQLTLLRIIQEACNNTVKHANASKIDVLISYLDSSISLKVVDDGDGFNTSTLSDNIREDNSGFGLSIMRERIYLLSGKISLESNPGEGCTIIVTIPRDGNIKVHK